MEDALSIDCTLSNCLWPSRENNEAFTDVGLVEFNVTGGSLNGSFDKLALDFGICFKKESKFGIQ